MIYYCKNAYGFGKNVLDLVYGYLQNSKQRVKIDTTFSTWTDLINGLPQRSVLSPLFFDIYLNDLFFFFQDINIYNFADDATPFVCNKTLERVLDKLERNSELGIFWIENNYIKLNTDKCHLLDSGRKYEHSWAKTGHDKICESNEIKLLGVTIENKLIFCQSYCKYLLQS